MAVVYTIADKLKRYAPFIIASKFCGGITRNEQAPFLITVVTTVIVVITAIMIWDTFPIVTGEGCRMAGVKS